MKFVGEIGIPRQEFLYDLNHVDLIQIERGYDRRHRQTWGIARWQTYLLMSVSMADLKKAGIYKPTDLLKFPWDKSDEEMGDMPDAKEIARLQQTMREENATRERVKKEQNAKQE